MSISSRDSRKTNPTAQPEPLRGEHKRVYDPLMSKFAHLSLISILLLEINLYLCASQTSHLEENLNPNLSLDRYSADRYGKDNFLSSFIFLLASCCSFVLDVARYAFKLTINHLLNNLMKSVQNLMTDLG